MGTSVPSAYIAELLRMGTACNVWLDPDAAGQRAANKYIKQLRAYGVAVRNIVSQRDPKLHFISEIQEILQ
jgi:DNA primase